MKQFLFTCFFLLTALPASAAGGTILEGRVTGPKGEAVTGAELRLIDPSGKVQSKALSDTKGLYRFPAVLDLRSCRLKISHVWFNPIEVESAITGANVVASQPRHLKPGEPIALSLLQKTLSRDFLLTPSLGTPQIPSVGPIDPNLAEYYYQRGLLLLGENKKSEAITYLTLYAQTGNNLRQVNRAIELIVENQ